MLFKGNVVLKPFHGLSHLVHCVDTSFNKFMNHDALMTSACDSKHMENSLHYKARAWDFRIAQKNDTYLGLYPITLCNLLVADLQARLGTEYDVVLEYKKLHVHIEYDPEIECIEYA